MAEKVTKDTGLMQRTAIQYCTDDPDDMEAFIAALKAWGKTCPVARPGEWPDDAWRRHTAERYRAILASVGIDDDGTCVMNTGPLRAKGLAEHSAQWIAAQWLTRYNALMLKRERYEAGDKTPGNISYMLIAIEEMGKLQERMWWRAGVDPVSGERREALALTGRLVKRGQKDGAAITNKAHAAKREARFARMRALVPSVGVENAARQCEAEHLGGWQAIRRQWDRHKRKPDI